MKKLLFLLIASGLALLASAQVTVTIDNVTPVTKGQVKGDLVTFTISAEGYGVWGVGVSVLIGGEKNGGGGLWNPRIASNKTGTYHVFVGLMGGSLNKERVYKVTVLYEPLDYPYDPADPYYVISEPFTVTK